MYLWCPSQMCVLLLSYYNLLIWQIWWTFLAALRKGIQQGSLNLLDFTAAKFHRRTASLVIYYTVALILWPISAVVICLGIPGIAGHTFLQFCHWKKRGEKMRPWVSWVCALGQGTGRGGSCISRSGAFLILEWHPCIQKYCGKAEKRWEIKEIHLIQCSGKSQKQLNVAPNWWHLAVVVLSEMVVMQRRLLLSSLHH